MPQDRDDPPAAASEGAPPVSASEGAPPVSASEDAPSAAPTPADFDHVFSAAATSPGLLRVWQAAEPDLPPEIEPFSFVSVGLLRHVLPALDLAPGQTLVDLACGRGGPGLWLAQQADADLVGVDFSPVGISQAAARAALFGLAGRARFVVGHLMRTGLQEASADAIVCIDAFHFASDPAAAAAEARRVLRPGRRLVLTNWQPKVPGDTRLPSRRRIDWSRLLSSAGFTDVETVTRPEWRDVWTRVYRVALDLGEPGPDIALADLQDEARKRLPLADLMHRVAVTATAPLGLRPLDEPHGP
jgi:ubiquinone/menaquinone biosynthesis C-methylase UbiE